MVRMLQLVNLNTTGAPPPRLERCKLAREALLATQKYHLNVTSVAIGAEGGPGVWRTRTAAAFSAAWKSANQQQWYAYRIKTFAIIQTGGTLGLQWTKNHLRRGCGPERQAI